MKKKYIDYDDRIRIELLRNVEKNSAEQIAKKLGYSERTIYRELRRGCGENGESLWRKGKRYSAWAAQLDYNKKASAKGPRVKIGGDHAFAAYVEDKMLNDKYSPEAVLMEIERSAIRFSVSVSKTTLYSYIDKGLFLHLTNKNLPCGKRGAGRKYNKVRRLTHKDPLKESIERRPAAIDNREEFGHWEIDTVRGARSGKSACLLVLTERKTREEIGMKLPACTSAAVVQALNRLERKFEHRRQGTFARLFKTMTADNGSEFADWQGMERSCCNDGGKRTKMYFCHPYSSFERGSNENCNKLIRRFIPKGAKIAEYSEEEIERIICWVNQYPRRILGGKASGDLFGREFENFFKKLTTNS